MDDQDLHYPVVRYWRLTTIDIQRSRSARLELTANFIFFRVNPPMFVFDIEVVGHCQVTG
ncbi:hypothetical protein A2U01_0021497, partial [Trifolium medium]|nr:hypothetical protein [Trifolium medium]